MPLIEEVDDDQMVEDEEQDLATLLKQLSIPPDYNRREYLAENPAPELDSWKRKTISVLGDIRRIVNWKETRALGVEARDIVFAVVPFAQNDVGEDLELNSTRLQEGWEEDGAEAVAQGKHHSGASATVS